MISAPLLADNDNDWAAGAPLLLARFGDGTLDLCRSGGMAGVRSFGISRDQDLHLRALQLSFDQLKRHSGLWIAIRVYLQSRLCMQEPRLGEVAMIA